MTRARLVFAALLLAPGLAWGAAGRFALVLGNNEGGPGRARLWFAEQDAERFARALTELGGFAPDAVVVLRGAGLSEARGALARLEARIASSPAADSSLLVVFFSGHASAEGLELGGERWAFDELRAAMQRSSAGARVAIVDACESGALTQVKGARLQPDIDFALPQQPLAKGVAYIASTAAGEAAQESAALGASFFTFHLDAALRGAGDADGDGQVTLAEAFRYTSARTTAGTAGTTVGPQHPTYAIRMAGRGDVVLTTLRRAQARLVLPGGPGDRFLLRGEDGFVAEAPGGSTLALARGRYQVERRSASERQVGVVELERGETRALPALSPAPMLASRGKGGEQRVTLLAGASAGTALLPGLALDAGMRLGARFAAGGIGWMAQLEYRAGNGTDRALRYDLSSLGVRLAALLPVASGTFEARAGVEALYARHWQSLDSGAQPSASSVGIGPCAVAGWGLGRLELALQVGAPVRVVRINEQVRARAGVEGAALVGWRL